MANTWNASAFGRSLGMSDHSVNHYLDYHEGAFLVQRLKPFFVNARKRMVKSPKVYLRDSGILHRLLRIADRNALQHHIALGASWEGYVIEQIRRTISDQLDLYYYRTHGGAELDLVITKADKPLYGIEIKYSSAPVLSKGSFESIDDLKLKKTFVIVPSGTEYPLRKDIHCLRTAALDEKISSAGQQGVTGNAILENSRCYLEFSRITLGEFTSILILSFAFHQSYLAHPASYRGPYYFWERR
jgi:predicted AAA+ superfamily ATPase